MPVVMLVEDEPVLREALTQGLRSVPTWDVISAETAEEARAMMRLDPPSVLVSDLHLPGDPGFSLLEELKVLELEIPVIFLTAYLGDFADRIPEASGVEVHEKPVRVSWLRQRIAEQLDASKERVSAPFTLIDYLQMAELGRYSVVIRMWRAHRRVGRIVVVEGRIWSAESVLGEGIAAIEALAFDSGRIEIRSLSGPPGRQMTELSNLTVENIVLGVLQRKDEATRQPEGIAPPEDSYRQMPQPVSQVPARFAAPDESFDDLISELEAMDFEEGQPPLPPPPRSRSVRPASRRPPMTRPPERHGGPLTPQYGYRPGMEAGTPEADTLQVDLGPRARSPSVNWLEGLLPANSPDWARFGAIREAADLAFEEGRMDDARRLYRRAQRLRPEDPAVQTRLDILGE